MSLVPLKVQLKAWRQHMWQLAEAENIVVRDDEEIQRLNIKLDEIETILFQDRKRLVWNP